MARAYRSTQYAGGIVRLSAVVAFVAGLMVVAPTARLWAQLPALKPAHLNPAIEKLAAGGPVFGAITSDLSMASARQWASPLERPSMEGGRASAQVRVAWAKPEGTRRNRSLIRTPEWLRARRPTSGLGP